MTVQWTNTKDAITRFIQATGVVDADHVLWDKDAAKLVLHESSVELRITGEHAVGDDDVAQVADESGVYALRVSGLREFVLSIRFRSRSPEDAYAARDSLETIRASFHHPLRRALLTDAGVAYLATEMLETRDVTYQGRWEQMAVLDVRMSVLSMLIEPGETAPYVQSVSMNNQGEAPFVIPE